jgi:transposase
MKPLDARQLRAANLLGRGGSAAEVAEEVGVSRRTVQSWRKREDFREAEAMGRRAAESEAPSTKTMRAVLEEAALTACRPGGDEPDWPTRVRAAAALTRAEGFGAPPEPPAPEAEIFDENLDDEEDAPPQVDVAAFYEAWDGTVSQAEADLYERADLYDWTA